MLGLFLAASAATAGAALVVVVGRLRARPAPATSPDVVSIPVPASEPIPAEAGVFRTTPATLAIGDPATPRRNANPRTLHTFQTRRAFPGAPPAVPHGLTSEEFQTTTCNSCHERGGFSPRFGAYVPVTPHPEFAACLQCHVGDDAITAVTLPSYDPNTICRQCHDPDGLTRSGGAMEWSASRWPRLASKGPNRPPPPIPHEFHLRETCVACHFGPGAVAEIRTDHPERGSCRQCHIRPEADAAPFARPTAGAPVAPERGHG